MLDLYLLCVGCNPPKGCSCRGLSNSCKCIVDMRYIIHSPSLFKNIMSFFPFLLFSPLVFVSTLLSHASSARKILFLSKIECEKCRKCCWSIFESSEVEASSHITREEIIFQTRNTSLFKTFDYEALATREFRGRYSLADYISLENPKD